MRALTRLLLAVVALATSLVAVDLIAVDAVVAQTCPTPGSRANAQVSGGSATGNARCYRSDGQPYYEGGDQTDGPVCWYDGLYYTTQDEQRNEIRPEETRPGQWGWLVCDDGSSEFMFFPDAEPVDPAFLARSVTITPGVPQLRANPPLDGQQLVNLESWFWIDRGNWTPVTDGASAGTVSVTVTATPQTLVINPGDRSPSIDCPGGGTPYDTSRSAETQSSDCTHTYERSGNFTATATIVYEVTWTSNLGVGGNLGTLTPDAASFPIEVAESQAVVTGD